MLFYVQANDSAATMSLGTLLPGHTVDVSWQLAIDDSESKDGSDNPIVVVAQGIVQGSVPATVRNKTSNFPAYSYEDWIGGSTVIHY